MCAKEDSPVLPFRNEGHMDAKSSEKGKNSEMNDNNIGNVRLDGHKIEEDDELEELKRRISGHPLYGVLTEAHLNCVKVGLVEIGGVGPTNATTQANLKRLPWPPAPTSSTYSAELDRFMEEYCITLWRLKEAMEEPLLETASFVEAMYIQLRELGQTIPPEVSQTDKLD